MFFSVSGSVFTDLEKIYPSPFLRAWKMLLKQFRPLSATWIVLPDIWFHRFRSSMMSRITGFLLWLPGYIFIPTGIWCESRSRPRPTIGSLRFSFEGPLSRKSSSRSISK